MYYFAVTSLSARLASLYGDVEIDVIDWSESWRGCYEHILKFGRFSLLTGFDGDDFKLILTDGDYKFRGVSINLNDPDIINKLAYEVEVLVGLFNADGFDYV